MRRRSLSLLLALPLFGAGCACPAFDGLDGVLTFQACDDLQRPLMTDSVFPIELQEEPEDATTTWVSDEEGVVTVTGAARAWLVEAVGPGEAQVSVETDEGLQDRLAFEVVDGASASLRDPWTDVVRDMMIDREDEFGGAIPLLQPSDPVQVFAGASVDLTLEVLDADDRPISWSPEAVQITNAQPGENGALTVSGPSEPMVVANGGAVLFDGVVAGVSDLSGVSIAMGVWGPPRTEPEEITDETSFGLGYVQAVVTDEDGRPIYQAPLEWSSRGIGQSDSVDSASEGDDPDRAGRTDLVFHALSGNDAMKWESAIACVSVRLETPDGPVVGSALFAPGGAETFEDDNCAGASVTPAGCGCSAVDPQGASLLSLLVAAGVLSRRRRSAGRPGRGGRCRTAA